MPYSATSFNYIPNSSLGNYLFNDKKGLYIPNKTYQIIVETDGYSIDNFFRVTYNHNYSLKASGRGWNIYLSDGLSSEGRFSISSSVTNRYTTVTTNSIETEIWLDNDESCSSSVYFLSKF